MHEHDDDKPPIAAPGRPAPNGDRATRPGAGANAETWLEGAVRDADDEIHEDLLLDFQRGDAAAFDKIVGRFEAPLWRFFYRLCWDRDRAEDFVQDVFLRVYRTSQRYEPRGRLSTFLYRIATNRWIDHWRSMRPRPTLFSLDNSDREEESPILERVAGDTPDPSYELEMDQDKARLRRAIDSLTLPHRLVFELAVYQNLPYPQISELLGIPVGTVKSRMHNTTKALKQLLQEGDEDETHSSERVRPLSGRRRNRA